MGLRKYVIILYLFYCDSRHFKMIHENNVHIIFILGNLQKQAMLSSRFLFHFIISILLCQLYSLLCKQLLYEMK